MLISTASADIDYDFEEVASEEGLYLGSPIYTNSSGQVLTALSPGDEVNVSITVRKNTSGSINLSAITGIYSSDDTMLGVTYGTGSVSEDAEQKIEYCFVLPANVTSGCYLKTFILNSVDGFYSYSRSFSCFKEGFEDVYDWKLGDGWQFSSQESRSGYSSLMNSGISDSGAAELELSLNGGSAYKISFYSKGDGAKCSVKNDFDAENAAYYTETSENWRYNSFVFGADESDSGKLVFNADNGGKVFIDDLIVSTSLENNGSFEDMSDGWIVNDSLAQITDESTYNGEKSLKITSHEAGEAASSEVDVLPQRLYILSYMSLCREKVNCCIYDGSGAVIGQNVKAVKTAQSEWTPNYIVFNSGDSSKINICYATSDSKSKVSYIDSVSLKEIEYGNLIIGGDCEENSLSAWTKSFAGVSVDFEADTSVCHSGNSSIRVFNRSVGHAPITQHSLAAAVKQCGNGKYRICGWIQYPEETTFAMIKVFSKHGGKNSFDTLISINQNSSNITDENGFRYLEGDFEITDAETFGETYVSVYASNTEKLPFRIDDIALYKLSD